MIKVLLRTLILDQCIDAFYINVVNNFLKPKLQTHRLMSRDEVSVALKEIFPELFRENIIKLSRQTGKTNVGAYYAMRYIYDKDDDKTFDL